MNIRIMTLNDYEQVYSLWINTPNMGLNNIDDTIDGIEKYLNKNPDTCFVALKDSIIIGAILSGHDGRRGFIYHMAVKSDEHNHGVGTALLNASVSALEKEGITKVSLLTKVHNENGNAFFEKHGFIKREDLIYRNKDIIDVIRLDT